jgi:hypothetical protein
MTSPPVASPYGATDASNPRSECLFVVPTICSPRNTETTFGPRSTQKAFSTEPQSQPAPVQSTAPRRPSTWQPAPRRWECSQQLREILGHGARGRVSGPSDRGRELLPARRALFSRHAGAGVTHAVLSTGTKTRRDIAGQRRRAEFWGPSQRMVSRGRAGSLQAEARRTQGGGMSISSGTPEGDLGKRLRCGRCQGRNGSSRPGGLL